MSFSSSVKEEICAGSLRKDSHARIRLAGLVRLAGTIEITSGMRMLLRLDTETEAVALHAMTLIRRLYGETVELSLHEGRPLRRQKLYSVRVTDPETAHAILENAGILAPDSQEEGWLRSLTGEGSAEMKAFLQGAFLAAGSVTDPEKEYHLEIDVRDEGLAEELCALANDLELPMRLSNRAESQILYLKDADDIADFLSTVGAHGSLLQMENVRVVKSVRNQVNRTVNCETGNLRKVMEASRKQIEYIRALEAADGFSRLSPSLRRAAELRLEYEEASLQELSDLMPGVSRTAMNKRLRRVVEIAKDTLGEI